MKKDSFLYHVWVGVTFTDGSTAEHDMFRETEEEIKNELQAERFKVRVILGIEKMTGKEVRTCVVRSINLLHAERMVHY